MRLFFAVELPHEVKTALAKLRPDAPWAHDYRWVAPASMHITLAFLGEQPEQALQALTRIGTQAASTSQAGKLSIGQPGSFGSKRAPRVLWAGLEGDLPRLHHLHRNLAEGLEQHNFAVENRPFSPHITLARRREHATSGQPPQWLPLSNSPTMQAPLDTLTLFHSQLSTAGARYTPLAHWPLAPGH